MEHQKEAVLHSYNLFFFINLEMTDLSVTTSGKNRFHEYA